MEAMIDGVWKAEKKAYQLPYRNIKDYGIGRKSRKLAYYEKELLVLNLEEFNLLVLSTDTIKKFAVNNIDGNKKLISVCREIVQNLC